VPVSLPQFEHHNPHECRQNEEREEDLDRFVELTP
jgi:hypothetical protein